MKEAAPGDPYRIPTDEQVADFRSRPLDAGPYTFVAADALTMKVREGGRVVLVHVLIGTGVNADGHREVLGVNVTSAEDGAGWLAFVRDLTVRGLSGVSLVTSDAHPGLVAALGATLPGASWQRCRTHYAANLMAVTPKARLRPTSPFGLTYAIVSSIARREAEMVAEIAREVGLLEQRVMAEADEDPHEFLSELFAARHELLTIKTMAEQGSDIYRRAIKLTRFAPPEGLELMKDVLDQYETVMHISDSQLRFLGHFVDPAALGPQTGLVVITLPVAIRAASSAIGH